jgi:Tfp pilus assembly protein PilF
MEIPAILEEQSRQGRVVLLLGAGASTAAKDSKGNSPPTGRELARLLSTKFLGGQYSDADLSSVAEYAVSEQGLLQVQTFICEVFQVFEPTKPHLLLPRFRWAGLATTNYDLLVEKAYARVSDALQTPVPFIENGDQVIEVLRDPKNLMYLKLHGCISRISNEKCPLILTKDQYITYRQGRDRIFQHLHEWAYEHTIVFAGHSVQDLDIREIIFELDTSTKSRPRYFFISPNPTEIERRFWETKKVTILDGTFSQFLDKLDQLLTGELRGLVVVTREQHAIAQRFRVPGAVLTKNCAQFLTTDAVYVSACNSTKSVSPSDFYTGYNAEWAPIEQDLDVRRAFADDIIEDVFLVDDLQERKPLELILITGYAGSGKSVSLRRIAWDAAKSYNCLCIYLEDTARINVGAIQELIELCRERLFLFADNGAERIRDFRELLNSVGEYGTLLTVITAARNNEWNLIAGEIQSSVTTEYQVPALKHSEILDLLDLLEKHRSLGHLATKSKEERFHEFEALAGRQLLVALHEATLGRPFEEIVESEFRNLVSDEARQVYLTVCILNRLGVPVRAGIISRVHGLPFSEFKARLFKPLEHVVYSDYDERIRDNVYQARHPVIAEIVFDRLLNDPEQRFREYHRCLSALNIDYSTDDKAFRQLVRARTLLGLFPNPSHCKEIFEVASSKVGDEPHLLQQKAIYEMHRADGDLSQASAYLSRAIEAQPYNRTFKHTKAELAFQKVNTARTDLEREKLLREATTLAIEAKDSRFGETHSYHTLAKVNVKRLEIELQNGNTDFTDGNLQSIVRNIEAYISEGLQIDPRSSYLLAEQANLATLLKDSPRTVESLKKAVDNNPKLAFLAIQLSDCYLRDGDVKNAGLVLEHALNANRSDRKLNYRFGVFLSEHGGSPEDVSYYLRRSFVPGDQNYDAQLRYARALFICKDYEGAREQLSRLRNNRYLQGGQRLYEIEGVCHGLVSAIRHTNLFAKELRSQLAVFISRASVPNDVWSQLTEGVRITFRLAFNFKGATGFDCRLA